MSVQHLSNSQVKYVSSLKLKKYRDQSGCFLAEGKKCVSELLARFRPESLVIQSDSYAFPDSHFQSLFPVVLQASERQFNQMSSLVTPADCLAVFRRPAHSRLEIPLPDRLIALDGVQDPGNLGTIIRTCDWMGFNTVLCSPQTADCFAPKVVQATMGALARVRLLYGDLPSMLRSLRQQGYELTGTTLDGENVYASDALHSARKLVIVMGNEGNGITPAVRDMLTRRITIPAFAAEHVESLNVSIATAIILSETQRKQ